MQSNSGAVQKMVMLKSPPGRRARDRDQDMEQEGDGNGILGEQNYIEALGADNMEGEWNILLLVRFYCHQIVMTDLPHDLTLQKMMMGCQEWLDPLYSPFRKSNVDTAWLRLVRAIHIHLVWTKTYSSSIIYFLSLSLIASELARTPAKTVTFSTSPDIDPATPTRTGRSELGAFTVWFLFGLYRNVPRRSLCLFKQTRGVKAGLHREWV